MTPKQRAAERVREAIRTARDWNADYRPGQLIEYKSHPEAVTFVATHARSEAFVVDEATGNARACISLKNVQGIVAIANCRAITGSASAEFGQAAGIEPTPAERRRHRLRERLAAIGVELDLGAAACARPARRSPATPAWRFCWKSNRSAASSTRWPPAARKCT